MAESAIKQETPAEATIRKITTRRFGDLPKTQFRGQQLDVSHLIAKEGKAAKPPQTT